MCLCSRHPSDPQILRKPESWAERRGRLAVAGLQMQRRISHIAPPARLVPFHLFLWHQLKVQPAVRQRRDAPEKEETHRAIFHHYILHFLINEIQSMQTACLVDHHLRENHRPNLQCKVKKKKKKKKNLEECPFG